MPNLIEYLPIIQEGFEECRVVESTTGWMEQNAREEMMRWISPNKFIIQTFDVDGFGDYPSNCECFPTGGFTIDNKTFELGFRRSKRFCWDRANDIDTKGIASAGNILRVFRQKHVVPEVDSFRYSKLANYAIDATRVTSGKSYTDPAIALKDFRADILKVIESGTVKEDELIAIITLPLKKGIMDLAGSSACCNVSSGKINNYVDYIDIVDLLLNHYKNINKK